MKLCNPLWKAWERSVQQYPDREAFIQTETATAYTLSQLNEEINQFSQLHLLACSGRVIAFGLRNKLDWLKLFLGCQLVNATALPLDPNLAGGLLAETAKGFGADFLWDQQGLQSFNTGGRKRPGIACIKLTSGTSSQPKPISCRAEHLIADGMNVISTMKIRSKDRNLALIPFGHSYGLGNLIMPLILQGCTLISAEEFVVGQIPSVVKRFNATVFPTVPAVLQMLTKSSGIGSLSPLRLVISAGAILHTELAQQFAQRFQLKIHNFYGTSETGGIAYDRSGQATLSGRSIGRPLEGVTIHITNRGRVLVSSRAVSNPRRRAQVPDRGTLNRWGELSVQGRVQPVANIGGRKVSPVEIENVLRKIAGVTDAWVGIIHQNGRDHLVACVESLHPKAFIEAEAASQLPEWKRPRMFQVLTILPRTPRGKLNREELVRMF